MELVMLSIAYRVVLLALRGSLLKYFKVGCIFVGCHQIVVLLLNLGERHWFAIHYNEGLLSITFGRRGK